MVFRARLLTARLRIRCECVVSRAGPCHWGSSVGGVTNARSMRIASSRVTNCKSSNALERRPWSRGCADNGRSPTAGSFRPAADKRGCRCQTPAATGQADLLESQRIDRCPRPGPGVGRRRQCFVLAGRRRNAQWVTRPDSRHCDQRRCDDGGRNAEGARCLNPTSGEAMKSLHSGPFANQPGLSRTSRARSRTHRSTRVCCKRRRRASRKSLQRRLLGELPQLLSTGAMLVPRVNQNVALRLLYGRIR